MEHLPGLLPLLGNDLATILTLSDDSSPPGRWARSRRPSARAGSVRHPGVRWTSTPDLAGFQAMLPLDAGQRPVLPPVRGYPHAGPVLHALPPPIRYADARAVYHMAANSLAVRATPTHSSPNTRARVQGHGTSRSRRAPAVCPRRGGHTHLTLPEVEARRGFHALPAALSAGPSWALRPESKEAARANGRPPS